jgi:hypothetical protein
MKLERLKMAFFTRNVHVLYETGCIGNLVEEKWRVHGLVSEYPAGILIPENNVVPF